MRISWRGEANLTVFCRLDAAATMVPLPGLVVVPFQHPLHFLELQALSLRHGEEDDDESQEGDTAEEEEGGRCPECLGQGQERLRHDEIGDPVGDGRDAAADAPEPQRVDLRVDDPRHRAHAGRVGDDVRAQSDQRQPSEVVRAPLRVELPVVCAARMPRRVVQHQARSRKKLQVRRDCKRFR